MKIKEINTKNRRIVIDIYILYIFIYTKLIEKLKFTPVLERLLTTTIIARNDNGWRLDCHNIISSHRNYW